LLSKNERNISRSSLTPYFFVAMGIILLKILGKR
jgi:hypothetical protein